MKNVHLIKLGILLIAGMFLPFEILAQQEVEEELQKIRDRYQSFKNIEFETHYLFYVDDRNSAAVDSFSGKIIQNGNDMFQQMKNIEILKTANISIMVDHDYKTLYMLNDKEVGKMANSFQMDIKEFLKKGNISKFEKLDKVSYAITLSSKVDAFQVVKIKYNPKTYLISEVEMNSSLPYTGWQGDKEIVGKPIIVIHYTNYKLDQKKIHSKIPGVEKYLKRENDRFVLTESFKEYELKGRQ